MKTAEQIFKKYGLDSLSKNTVLVFDWPDTKKLKQDIEALVKERDYYKERWLDDMLDSFTQECYVQELDMYDHMHMATYEYMQIELIKHGKIKESECWRK